MIHNDATGNYSSANLAALNMQINDWINCSPQTNAIPSRQYCLFPLRTSALVNHTEIARYSVRRRKTKIHELNSRCLAFKIVSAKKNFAGSMRFHHHYHRTITSTLNVIKQNFFRNIRKVEVALVELLIDYSESKRQ